jgi:hypothetical protein
MLHLASKIHGAPVRATDGDIGAIEEFYFEPFSWMIRYIVVNTGKWLNHRRVVLSPMLVRGPWGMSGIPVDLTREQVRSSPELDPRAAQSVVDPDEPELQSTKAIAGDHIQASDGEIGHVDDFLIGDESWRIRYVRVDTSNWIGGKSVVVRAATLGWIDRTKGRLHIGLTRDAVKNGPSFESIEPMIGFRETGPRFAIL